ncbi:CopG family transcriptional regulator [Polynucleobacter sp. UK-Mo-2m-Kol15]|jgi:RHH-type rel operon transcriptional repressor/antitoxin RelB|uniref:type II toxin-antitoxin system RelB family antitoxin n=1 Tax=Polynucleobacter sp. UK-Mo-2m-Kol15 TaxID=2576916 RepID=UPI001C0D3E9F|nr:CopG family transcriptional regulator [Polynucleobacter sp. UK-Mo-2m-Kol15]MBU3575449.1 CopG family transcriptional regulator [Polynucleobacter sp. UK-Mo-2m-Kol15]
MLAIRLPKEIELRLDFLAKATGRTKTFYAREAILAYLEDLEDVYLADKSMKALKSGKVKAIPLDQVERNLGLAD